MNTHWDEKFFLMLLHGNIQKDRNGVLYYFNEKRGVEKYNHYFSTGTGNAMRWDYATGHWRLARPRVATAMKLAAFASGVL